MNIWDAEAATFDDQPDHGLRDPEVRAAWAKLLLPLMPPKATVADLGCGTGSLALLLAEHGHHVCGIDLSPAMLDVARGKAGDLEIDFRLGDVADPPAEPGSFDVVLVRHVLWAMPDPQAAVDTWVRLLAPGGRLILVEGRWFTGAGLSQDRCRAIVEHRRRAVEVRVLDDPALWGKEIDDERYLLLSPPVRPDE